MFKFFDDQAEPQAIGAEHTGAGKVRFDDRGNAIYDWNNAQLELDGRKAERLRERALLNPALALVDDSPETDSTAIRNDKGLRLGYNPYQSGQLAGKPAPKKKRDIRELSKWIEMQRRLGLLSPVTELKK